MTISGASGVNQKIIMNSDSTPALRVSKRSGPSELSSAPLLKKNEFSPGDEHAISPIKRWAGEIKLRSALSKIDKMPKVSRVGELLNPPSFTEFDLPTTDLRKKFTEEVAKKYAGWLNGCLSDFQINDISEKIKLADMAISSDRANSFMDLVENSPHWQFYFKGKSAVFALCEMALQKSQSTLFGMQFLLKDNRLNQQERIEIAEALAQVDAGNLGQHIGLLKIDDLAIRKKLARTVIASGCYFNLQEFNINNENDRIDLARYAQETRREKFAFTGDFNINKMQALAQLYANAAAFHMYAEGSVPDYILRHYFNNKINIKFNDKNCDLINKLCNYYGSSEMKKISTSLLKDVGEIKDPHAKAQSLNWLQFANLLALGVENADQMISNHVEKSLKWIQKLRAPVVRNKLTVQFMNSINRRDQATNLAYFSSNFSRPHALGFAIALFPAYYTAYAMQMRQDMLVFKSLCDLLNNDYFKNSKQLTAMIGGLIDMKLAHGMTPARQRTMMAAVLPCGQVAASSNKRQLARELMRSVQQVNILLRLSSMPVDAAAEVARQIDLCRTPADMTQALINCCLKFFPSLKVHSTEIALQKMGEYLERCRQPEALFVHASHINNSSALKDVMASSFQEFMEAVIWSDRPQVFQDLRYDLQRSHHLKTIASARPEVFDAWKKAPEPLHSQSNEKGASSEVSTRSNVSWQAVETDHAEDLLLSGTEVVGSCQRIDGDISLSKSLMGSGVLDGKTRMLAVKAADGRLMARRMLRLLWDDVQKTPVLLLDREYSNAGVDHSQDDAMVALAKRKAADLGCALVTIDQRIALKAEYPNLIQSLSCPAPFEHVDAYGPELHHGRMTDGVYTLGKQAGSPPLQMLWPESQ